MNIIAPGSTEGLPWYIAGPLLGLFVPLLLLLTGKDLGISSSFRHFCTLILPKKVKIKVNYFNYQWQTGAWQILFVLGILFGGFLTAQVLGGANIELTAPESHTIPGLFGLFGGGLLVGFGTRWADGCTSGHTIAGISQLQIPSMIASVCFIVGGVSASLIHRFIFNGGVL